MVEQNVAFVIIELLHYQQEMIMNAYVCMCSYSLEDGGFTNTLNRVRELEPRPGLTRHDYKLDIYYYFFQCIIRTCVVYHLVVPIHLIFLYGL